VEAGVRRQSEFPRLTSASFEVDLGYEKRDRFRGIIAEWVAGGTRPKS